MAKFNNKFKSQLKAYFIKRLGAFEYKHGWLKMDCPICGKEKKFGVNISLNRSNCFVCGYKEKPVDIVMELELISTIPEAKKYLDRSEFDGYEYKDEKLDLKQRKDLILPEGFRLITQGDSQLARSARNYVKSRGFKINDVAKKGWGYSNDENYFGYLIIPFYENGKLIYFNARAFLTNGPRYNNPNTDLTGVGKSMIIYNKDALYMYKSVYLCEGAINAETIGERGIASGGKFVSKYQVNDIIKSPAERLIIILDPDAVDKAVALAMHLIDYKKIKIIILPEGKDVNDLGRKKTLNIVYQNRYLTRQDLMKLKNSL